MQPQCPTIPLNDPYYKNGFVANRAVSIWDNVISEFNCDTAIMDVFSNPQGIMAPNPPCFNRWSCPTLMAKPWELMPPETRTPIEATLPNAVQTPTKPGTTQQEIPHRFSALTIHCCNIPIYSVTPMPRRRK